MLWLILSLFAALSTATNNLVQKLALNKYNDYIVSWAVWFFSLPIIIITLFIVKIPNLNLLSIFLLFITGILEMIAIILYVKAIKISGLAITVPFLSFTPVFLTIISWIFLNEIPSLLGASGIFLIFLGSYIIKTEGRFISFQPIRSLFRDKGSIYMLIAAFLYAVVTPLYKILINQTKNPLAVSGLAIISICILSTLYIMIRFKENPIRTASKTNIWILLIIGTLSALMSLASFKAQSLTLNAYMISVKRLSIVFSIIYGYIFFKEKGIIKNVVAALIMIFGTVLIAIVSSSVL